MVYPETVARPTSYVIIGNGIAGITAAETLRAHDSSAEITIVTDEAGPAYYRPALKDYLAQRLPIEKLWARPQNFYQEQRIRLLTDRVVGIQVEQHMLALQSGQRLSYQRLLLAQGAHANTLACPGSNLNGVLTLHTIADYQILEKYLSQSQHIVVTGSGTLAIETIETLRHRGYRITHLLRRQRLWSDVLDATASDMVLQRERHEGVDVRLEEEIAEITGNNGLVSGVITARGTHIDCDLVIAAIGINPIIDFVKRSGVSCGHGIRVGTYMNTSAPDIYAAGDVIETTDVLTGRTRLLGQWYPAIQQARIAAYAMLGLLDTQRISASNIFFNASFLFGLDFASVGMTSLPSNSQGYRVLIEDPQASSYRKIVFNGGVPVGMLALGDRNGVLDYKRAIDYRVDLSPVMAYLFAPDFQLSAWLDKQGVPAPMLNVRLIDSATSKTTHLASRPLMSSDENQKRERSQQPLIDVLHRPNIQPLTVAGDHFEIDMCIGCDRCMRACPVPLSSLVHIADLNQANVSEQIAPHVARFTEECVMCGSCVPVCPVDNHRDLLMLSLKQRLGSSWNNNVDPGRLYKLLPSGWNLPGAINRLRKQPMLNDQRLIPDNYLHHLLIDSAVRILQPGETIIEEGTYGRNLYLILDGHVNLSARGIHDQDIPVAILSVGEYIGEYGMLTGQTYTTTARALSVCVMLVVPEQVMQRLMELVPAVHTFFEQLNDAHSLEAIMQRLTLFQGIAATDILYLIEQTQIRHYDREEILFQEENGRPARETLHILLEGFVKVSSQRGRQQARIIAYRQRGDYFVGGLDLLGDGRPVQASAITRVTVAEVSRSALLTIFRRYPEVWRRFDQRLQQYRDSVALSQSAENEASASLDALVGDGVVEGNEVLVIDLDKCVHCNECEEACARRHGYSRMNRKGMVTGNISIASACRQCQDPVCLLCSRAGIGRRPSGEVYITESCIGCGICAERCPYDNIEIVTVGAVAAPPEPTTWQRFSNFFTKGTGKEYGRKQLPMLQSNAAPGLLNSMRSLAEHEEIRKKVAVKCDLCAGYNNQACVQACPVSAVVRVRPREFFGSTEEILHA